MSGFFTCIKGLKALSCGVFWVQAAGKGSIPNFELQIRARGMHWNAVALCVARFKQLCLLNAFKIQA